VKYAIIGSGEIGRSR